LGFLGVHTLNQSAIDVDGSLQDDKAWDLKMTQ